MRAIIWTQYGPADGLKIRELEKPSPGDNEVLIRIHATTVTAGDCEMRTLKMPMFLGLPMRLYTGITRPTRVTIIGQELAGVVEAAGTNVTRFKVGDEVFATTGLGTGTYTEYVCLPEVPGDMDGALALKPANMSFEEATAVPLGGLEALHFLRLAHIQPGESVLINGAGGSIGTMGVQIAKMYGAEVTAVDHGDKLDTLLALGADHVIDYTQQDFTKNGQKYDVIFDIVAKASYSGCIRSLKPGGRYALGTTTVRAMLRKPWTQATSSKRVIVGASSPHSEDLEYLSELVEAGRLRTVIDRTYPLEQTAEAHRYVETGRKVGNLIICVA